MNDTDNPYLQRQIDNLGRTIGLHEEQRASQEQGIRIGFRAELEPRLPPSDDAAMKRLIKRVQRKQRTIKVGERK